MKIYLQILLAVCLLTANVNASSDPRNLLQIGTNFIPYPWYFQTGLSYDHLVGKKFTIGTSLWYERASMDVLDWHGLVAEASAKFLVWRFSEQSFGPSLYLSPTIGIGFFKLGSGSYIPASNQIYNIWNDKELHIPVSLAFGYLHQFVSNLVVSVGIKANPISFIIPLKATTKNSPIWFNWIPQLQVALGYAF
jgi:hypothetical protein